MKSYQFSEATNISYLLYYSSRKSCSVEVLPDKDVIIRVPFNTTLQRVESILLRRNAWIKKQREYFDSFKPLPKESRFFSGEDHFFLGKRYKLELVKSINNDVQLISSGEHNSFLVLYSKNLNPIYLKKLLTIWLRKEAGILLNELVEECWKSFSKKTGYTKKPELKIKKMKRSWGKMSRASVMTLNLDLMKTTKDSIRYVINHELCHLIHFNHSKNFYSLQEKITPNWKDQKYKLGKIFS